MAIKLIKSADLSRYTTCNTICNGKMITFNNSNPYLHRYTMRNTTCKSKIAIKIIKGADLSRYTTRNTTLLCNGKKMGFSDNMLFYHYIQYCMYVETGILHATCSVIISPLHIVLHKEQLLR